ncbi:ABSCISIC ACID-INSENSITIVE 5-like protein 2 [Prosopis cineraria]|uniref:ABSCISIC ACID-INSENSITIVE 5-like protein 2 n=1 Tax=Prosopis cineraria TaxID=364024 RepID=UPI00240F57EA|nr:ABSCISIC ACID-INSENSITIVE 5-like protein 2 [Prosopis cineraria]XP_054800057.1 ABSCISIC ACID-INSENSITIVE 5-like protein 2 [Prosopis cineraria]XP_054800058.1 ABSCISIC ACID-INSENSITIVE 5-like protein 2 [Prosopis cineraria]XP_054800059.1 ABSCISIC ACID-INSENSITIVE 5-like protein 2 [Prosopis cineraria]
MGPQGGAIQELKTASSLARQGSLYNLTLDEVQNQLGNLAKPLGSMNLDELLKSVWTAEAGQGQASGLDSPSGQLASESSLNRQGSLTLSGDLSKKTVEEVWKDILEKKSINLDRKAQGRQPTLGEMTLEDFLLKAGVAAESLNTKNDAVMSGVDSNVASMQNMSQHAHWLQYQLPPVQQPSQHPLQNQHNIMAGFMAGPAIQPSFPVSVLDPTYSETMVNMSPSSLMGTMSDSQASGRKRLASGDGAEKTVERRQKRMIKNRESAARSRARKQAYTNELEIKVKRLEMENERLRRLHMQEMERTLPRAPPPEPKHQLRRTNSASF